jgi:hypothetical protein
MFTAASVRSKVAAAVLVALAIAGSAGAAVSASSGIGVTAPRRVVQGNDAKIEVAVRNGTRCTLSFRYKNRAYQKGLGASVARGGKASWEWKVPQGAKPGAATARISCGAAGSATRTIVVVGSVIPASLTVLKQGFSVKPRRFIGADASWGVIVKNTSPQSDALNVTVLANFVMPDNKLIGSATVRIGRIPANMEYALGGDLSFPGVPPVSRLEIVAQIGESGKGSRTFPAPANVRILPDRFEADSVGSVEGEIQNDSAVKTMERAQLSTVVLDGAGNVIGGQTGNAMASLPPGSRQFFKISGMRGVTFSNAASAIVSVNPSYRGERLIP